MTNPDKKTGTQHSVVRLLELSNPEKGGIRDWKLISHLAATETGIN